jgi:hypothetical protein
MMAGAVLLGFVVIVAIVGATRLATASAFGLTPSAIAPPAYLAINVLVTMFAAGYGGYLCVLRAPKERAAISAGLLFVLFLGAGALAGRTLATPAQPLWFQATVTLLGASGLLSGLVIGASSRARAQQR